MTVTEIIKQLSATSSKKEKEAILLANKDNEDLKKVLFYTYSPSINFYITKIPEYRDLEGMNDLMISLDFLVQGMSTRKYTGNEGISYVSQLLSLAKDKEILEKIIKRDLDCGVQATTINKVWKGLCNEPPYMSYTLFSEKLLKSFKLPCYSQVKQDGLYADIKIYNDQILYTSRSGKDLKFRLPPQDEAAMMQDLLGVLHGEALVRDGNGGYLPREEGNGYLNSDNVDPELVDLVVWDMVTHEEYVECESDMIYEQRFTKLRFLIRHLSDHLHLVDSVWCETSEDIVNHFIQCRELGLEGTVVKQPDLLWKDTKTKAGLKLKNEFDFEVVITGVQPHKKHKDQIGALLVQSQCGQVVFKVGSGLNDKQRKEFFLQSESIIGKIATVKANDILNSESKDTYSAFLPRFVEIREDKSVADDLEKIMIARDSMVELLRKTLQ